MDKRLSVYLDLLRFVAAVMVLLCHASQPHLTTVFTYAFSAFGHDAVIVFFVLSGFVIAHTALHKDHDLVNYSLSRAARIYSVVVPAIVLTMIVDYARLQTSLIQNEVMRQELVFQFHSLWLHIPYWMAFGTQWWFLDQSVLSNGPFWSLSYEVWFYVIFGCAFYLHGKKRWIFALVALAIIGPRQWLLFPIWLLGYALYRYQEHWKLGKFGSRCFFASSIGLYALLQYTHTLEIINVWVNNIFGGFPKVYLSYSSAFVSDYIVGLLVAVNIVAARNCDFSWFDGRLANKIRFAASFTFSLYLFHMPLLEYYSEIMHADPGSLAQSCAIIAAVLATVVILGFATERRKADVRRVMEAVLQSGRTAFKSIHGRASNRAG